MVNPVSPDRLAKLPVTAFVTAFDTDGGFVLISVNRGAAVILQLEGSRAAQTALVQHVKSLPGVDTVVEAPQARGAARAATKGRVAVDADTRNTLLALPAPQRLVTIQGRIPTSAKSYVDALLARRDPR